MEREVNHEGPAHVLCMENAYLGELKPISMIYMPHEELVSNYRLDNNLSAPKK